MSEVRDVRAHDAVVIGGAAYMFHWLKDATTFATPEPRVALRERPVWLFSSGPVGTDLVDKDGPRRPRDRRPEGVRRADAPLLRARGRAASSSGPGTPTPRPSRFGRAHVCTSCPHAQAALPAGDFRDWSAIDAWAGEIAAALATDVSRT